MAGDSGAVVKRHDPALYRQMSIPFNTIDQANEALAAFFAEVAELRKKHRIADVVCLCEISHTLDGEEVRGSAHLHLGDVGAHLPMLAREYGAARQKHEDDMARLIANSRRAK